MKRFTEYIPYEYVVIVKFCEFPTGSLITRYALHTQEEKKFYTYKEALDWFHKVAEEEDDNDKVYKIELRNIKNNELIRWVE